MRSSVAIAVILVLCQVLACHGASPLNRLSFFDIDLLRYSIEDKKGNVMISPASIKTSLSMLLEGAQGITAEEIKAALRVSPVGHDFREELKDFLKIFQTNSTKVSLENANAMFISNKLKLNKGYEREIPRFYSAEINRLDFNDAKSTADTVNNWVDRKTHGLIPTIVDEDQITPSTEMMITNALYFKAPWKYGFNPKTTYTDCFYNKGVCTNVAMMTLQAELKYANVEDLSSHALELPYQDERYSMILLVPHHRDAGLAMIRDLPYIGLPQIFKLMDITDVFLTMPKFDVEYSDDMTEPLRNMHITTLFSQAANLTGIFEAEESAHLNSIYHSVHMKVDEVGTVAAAATSSVVVPLINDQIQLRINRPFLFFIRDNKLGVILFEGKIEEPRAVAEPSKVEPSKSNPQVQQQKNRPPLTDKSQAAQKSSPSTRLHRVEHNQATLVAPRLYQRDMSQQPIPVEKQVLRHVHRPVTIQPDTKEKEASFARSGFFGLFGQRVTDYICPHCY